MESYRSFFRQINLTLSAALLSTLSALLAATALTGLRSLLAGLLVRILLAALPALLATLVLLLVHSESPLSVHPNCMTTSFAESGS
jgi:hypothetical protein